MKRLFILVILSTLSSIAAADNKWYVGSGLTKAIPKILLDEAIGDVNLDIPDELGGGEIDLPISVDSDFVNYGQKIFAGYDLGQEKKWALEGSLINFGNYKGKLKTNVEKSGVSPQGIPYTISGDGSEKVTADIYGLTFSTIYSFQLGNRFSVFPRIGIAYINGRIVIEENASISITIPGKSTADVELERESSRLSVLLPVAGFGFDARITKQNYIRSEFERFGHPTKEPYIDVWSINWVYKFK